jgi:X-X-X-Leu-X-X-Gly heptad repeat protein
MYVLVHYSVLLLELLELAESTAPSLVKLFLSDLQILIGLLQGTLLVRFSMMEPFLGYGSAQLANGSVQIANGSVQIANESVQIAN